MQETAQEHHDRRDVVAHVPGDLVGLHVEDERGLDDEDHPDKDQDQVDDVEDDDSFLEEEPENEKSVIASGERLRRALSCHEKKTVMAGEAAAIMFTSAMGMYLSP